MAKRAKKTEYAVTLRWDDGEKWDVRVKAKSRIDAFRRASRCVGFAGEIIDRSRASFVAVEVTRVFDLSDLKEPVKFNPFRNPEES